MSPNLRMQIWRKNGGNAPVHQAGSEPSGKSPEPCHSQPAAVLPAPLGHVAGDARRSTQRGSSTHAPWSARGNSNHHRGDQWRQKGRKHTRCHPQRIAWRTLRQLQSPKDRVDEALSIRGERQGAVAHVTARLQFWPSPRRRWTLTSTSTFISPCLLLLLLFLSLEDSYVGVVICVYCCHFISQLVEAGKHGN